MKLPTIRELVHEQAKFTHYEDGKLWYQVIWTRVDPGKVIPEFGGLFDFPIPIDDTEGSKFLSADRAITFMRWMRRHLEYLQGALAEGVYDQ